MTDFGDKPLEKLYVIGGRQRAARSLRAGQGAWQGYDRGLVLAVDLIAETVSICFEYDSPPDVVADDDPAISFQGSTLDGDLLYTCTETEVMVYSVPSFELLHYVSLPCFNDVHHVRPSPSGNIIVANAGLEMVLEITPVGEIVGSWNALGQDPWAHVDPEVDYRKISTKPHRAHPNYVFYLGTELWATRFHQGDAVSLDRPGRSVHVSDERIHDGLVHKGKIYFTTVDGKIVIVDAERLDVIETIDLATFDEDRVLLGWCRGVLVDGNRLWVGFSRIRPTQFRENVGWVARGFKRDKPTHLACYDLQEGTCLSEIDLEPFGLSAFYSVLPAVREPGRRAASGP